MRIEWLRWATDPLPRMLVLSLSLHLALIMLVRPAPGSAQPRSVVISARLMETPTVRTRVENAQPIEPVAQVSAPVVPPVVTQPLQSEPQPASPAVPAPQETRLPMPAQPPSSEARVEAPSLPAALHSPVPLAAQKSDAASRSAEGNPSALPQVPVMLDTRWYTALEVDVHPQELEGQGPVFDYPEAAREQGVEGTVRVKLKVDEFGRIQHLEIVSGDPPGVFEEVVRKGFSQAAFSPARRNGVPVRALMQIRVRFDLE